MDKNNILSSMSNSKAQQPRGKMREAGEEGDVELFSKMLEERTAKLDQHEHSDANEEIYSDKKEKEKAEAEEQAKRARATRSSIREGSREHLQKLAMKDPDALSFAQKKTLGEPPGKDIAGSRPGFTAESAPQTVPAERKRSEAAPVSARTAKEDISKADAAPGARAESQADNEPDIKKALAESQEAERNVKREEVIKQIIQQVEMRNLGNRTELALKLNPEFLGEMKLRLLFGDNQVTAEFNTVSPAVRQAIEESREELISALQKKGVKVGRVNVKLVEEIR